jgi:hypothetical protein
LENKDPELIKEIGRPAQPEPAQPEPAQPEPAQPEPAQPEPAQPAQPPLENLIDNAIEKIHDLEHTSHGVEETATERALEKELLKIRDTIHTGKTAAATDDTRPPSSDLYDTIIDTIEREVQRRLNNNNRPKSDTSGSGSGDGTGLPPPEEEPTQPDSDKDERLNTTALTTDGQTFLHWRPEARRAIPIPTQQNVNAAFYSHSRPQYVGGDLMKYSKSSNLRGRFITNRTKSNTQPGGFVLDRNGNRLNVYENDFREIDNDEAEKMREGYPTKEEYDQLQQQISHLRGLISTGNRPAETESYDKEKNRNPENPYYKMVAFPNIFDTPDHFFDTQPVFTGWTTVN